VLGRCCRCCLRQRGRSCRCSLWSCCCCCFWSSFSDGGADLDSGWNKKCAVVCSRAIRRRKNSSKGETGSPLFVLDSSLGTNCFSAPTPSTPPLSQQQRRDGTQRDKVAQSVSKRARERSSWSTCLSPPLPSPWRRWQGCDSTCVSSKPSKDRTTSTTSSLAPHA